MKKQEKSSEQSFFQLAFQAEAKYKESLNFYFFILGLIGGQLLGINGNILYDIGKEFPGTYFEIIVGILTILFNIYLYKLLKTNYLKPLKKIINELKVITENEKK